MIKICLQCKNEYKVFPSTANKRKFCGKSCETQSRIGKKATPEHRANISKSLLGHVSWNKGKTDIYSEETLLKMSKSASGNKSNLGKKFSREHRYKISNALKGENAPGWKGGITEKNKADRLTISYKEWRQHVFSRDDYTCQACGERGGQLVADHVMSFSKYPDIRTEILNGQTLCRECHTKTPNYAYRAVTFEL